MDDIYKEGFDRFEADLEARSSVQLYNTLGVSPDEAAASIKLSRKSGVPAQVIQTDKKAWEADINLRDDIELARKSPALQRYINGNPMAAQVSRDDLPILDRIGRGIAEWSPLGAAVIGTEQGFRQQRYAQRAADFQLSRVMDDRDEAKRLEGVLKEFEEKAAADPSWNGVYWFANAFGQFAGALAASAASPGGVAGVGVGAAWGATAGAVAAGPVGALAGAVGGVTTGAVRGMAVDQSVGAAGRVYRTVDLLRDAQGNPIPEHIKHTVAAGVGLASLPLNLYGGNKLQSVVEDAVKLAMGKEVVQQTVGKFATEIAKNGLEMATLNAAGTLVEQIGEQIARAQGNIASVLDDPAQREKAVGELVDSIVLGAALGGTLGSARAAMSRRSPMRLQLDEAKTEYDLTKLDQLVADAAESKTLGRDPEMFAEAMAAAETRTRTVGIPARVAAAMQEDLVFVPDLQGQLERNLATNEPIEIPLAKFISEAAQKPELWTKVRADVGLDGGLTQNEIKELWTAYHGSPYLFYKFEDKFINTGEGTQWEGWGHYITDRKKTAAWYMHSNAEIAKGRQKIRIGEQEFSIDSLEPEIKEALGWLSDNEYDAPAAIAAMQKQVKTFNPEVKAAAITVVDGGDGTWDVMQDGESIGFYYSKSVAEMFAGEMRDSVGNERQTLTDAIAWLEARKDQKILPPDKLYPSVYRLEVSTDQEKLLRWDKTIEEQSPFIKEALRKISADNGLDTKPATVRQLAENSWTVDFANPLYPEMSPKGKKEFGDVKAAQAAADQLNEGWSSLMEDWSGQNIVRELEKKFRRDAIKDGFDEPKAEASWRYNDDSAARIEGARRAQMALRAAGVEGTQYLGGELSQPKTTSVVNGEPFDINNSLHQTAYFFQGLTIDEARGMLIKDIAVTKEEIRRIEKQITTTPEGYTRDELMNELEVNKEGLPGLERRFETLEGLTEIPRIETVSAKPNHNYVIFDPEQIRITHINDEPVPAPAALPIAAQIANAVDQERKALWLDQFFKNPKAVGITAADFAQYSKKLEAIQRKMTEVAFRAAEKEVARRETKTWRDRAREMVPTVEREIKTEPVHIADVALRTGKGPEGGPTATGKLSREEVDAIVPGASDLLPQNTLRKKDTEHPDVLADAYGFTSGKEMIEQLVALHTARAGTPPPQYMKRLIEGEVTKRMEAKYGKLDEKIAQQAFDLIVGKAQLDLIHDEVRMAADAAGEPLATREAIEAYAKEGFASERAEKVSSDRYRTAVEKGGLLAEYHLLRGDFVEAFRAKQGQLIAFIKMREARTFEKQQKQVERWVKAYSREPSRNSRAQAYTDQVQRLLSRLGVEINRNPEEFQEMLTREPTLDAFETKARAAGYPIEVPDWMRREGQLPQLTDLTVEQFSELRDVIKMLDTQGRQEKLIGTWRNQEELEDVVTKIVANVESLPQRGRPEDERKRFSLRRYGRYVDAAQLRMERLFDWLDRKDPNGPMNTYVFRPIREAVAKADGLRDLVTDVIKALPVADDRAWSKSLRDRITNQEFIDPKTQRPMIFTREMVLTSALNMGNESNWTVLTKGYGWDQARYRQFVLDNMTAKDWQYVQGVWNIFDKILKPEINASLLRQTGVGMDSIPARPVDTGRFGVVPGGYYPLIADRSRIDGAMIQQLELQELSPSGLDLLPARGYLKNRTGKAYPVELSVDFLPNRLNEVIHDLAFREPIQQARKILNSPKVRFAVARAFGDEYPALFPSWLNDIATNGGQIHEGAKQWLARLSRAMRTNTISSMIGFRLSTAVIHGGAAAANSMVEAGPGRFWKAAVTQLAEKMGKDPMEFDRSVTFAMQNSKELQARHRTFDRDIGVALWKMHQQGRIAAAREAYIYYATSLVRVLDFASTVPTWTAAYHRALDEGRDHDSATWTADKTVRNAHGSNTIVDLPAVMRGDEWRKWFTMFYGTFNHNYNQERDMVRDMRQNGARSLPSTFGRAMGYILIPALVHEAVRGHKSEDESWGKWAVRALSAQITSGFVFGREMAYLFLHDKRLGNTPYDRMMGGLAAPITGGIRWGFTDKEVKAPAQDIITALGYAAGFGGEQPAKLMQWSIDEMMGKSQPINWAGLILDLNPKPAKGH